MGHVFYLLRRCHIQKIRTDEKYFHILFYIPAVNNVVIYNIKTVSRVQLQV